MEQTHIPSGLANPGFSGGSLTDVDSLCSIDFLSSFNAIYSLEGETCQGS